MAFDPQMGTVVGLVVPVRSDDRPELFIPAGPVVLVPPLADAERWAGALLEILSQPWIDRRFHLRCPVCHALAVALKYPEDQQPHAPGCAWLIAAKACGIA